MVKSTQDIAAFIIAAFLIVLTISDGDIYLLTSLLLIVYYVIYVLVVVLVPTSGKLRFNFKSSSSKLLFLTFLCERAKIRTRHCVLDAPVDEEESELSVSESEPLLARHNQEEVMLEHADDFFGLPLDLHSALVSRPGSPILQAFPDYLTDDVSIEESHIRPLGSLERIKRHGRDMLTRLRFFVLGQGALASTRQFETGVLPMALQEDILPESHEILNIKARTISNEFIENCLIALFRTAFPLITLWSELSWWERAYLGITSPGDFVLSITVPAIYKDEIEPLQEPIEDSDTDDMEDDYGRTPQEASTNLFLALVQLFFGPLTIRFITQETLYLPLREWIICLAIGVCMIILGFIGFSLFTSHRFAFALSIYGFVLSIFWVYAFSNELVSLLQTFGIVFSLNQAILGLTVFAIGNSLLDLITNAGVARLV